MRVDLPTCTFSSRFQAGLIWQKFAKTSGVHLAVGKLGKNIELKIFSYFVFTLLCRSLQL
jgi:hypothetical protein